MSPAHRACHSNSCTPYPLLSAETAGFFWPEKGQNSQLRHKRGHRIRKMENVQGLGPYAVAVRPRGISMLTMLLLMSGYRLGSLLKPVPKTEAF
jgi:hypothetical protein